jgi:hypothetical protein
MVGPPVVDWARLKRIQVPETPGMNFITKVYLGVIGLCVICMIKRYRDIRLRGPSLDSGFLSESTYPREPSDLLRQYQEA